MIDWITARIPLALPAPIKGGDTVILDAKGDVEKVIPHRLKVEGSFSTSLAIRAPSTHELEISGNVVKWLQGHNLYGPECPIEILWQAMQRLEALGVLGCSLDAAGIRGPADLERGLVTRIDTTEMLTLADIAAVKAWLRTAYATGSVTNRGRGLMRGDTVIFGDAAGKDFTRSQIVFYSKGQEVEVHPLPDLMRQDAEVREWVGRQLRAEVRLGRLELEKLGLRSLAGWRVETSAHQHDQRSIARRCWEQVMAKLQFSETQGVDEKLQALPNRLAGIVAQWQAGVDLRGKLPRASFYRHRSEVLKAIGVDIAVPPPPVATAQIVPIRRVLDAQLSGRPPWADRIDAALAAQGCAVFPFRAA